ncbi:MAG: antibiotic biosynthesis monooxygenase [Rhodospirillales bacterium]|nr:antibiotic biosynthesis monooxygenase [Rhodospirillales bacterium]MCW8861780.1 antibiotic biosynthesis monooxygenase [Rhodospirillales bacterium]MCW8951538.1 antibiotic biosynthesis monooxygenase [Rhodospirillales bacterium]MCW8969792.1 antibiotic biosynthesis monooxygenase [Rhodospirillales bacterium]MCW9001712.1 antibiotic biosynthesis monooxygenase [Rhodospirillales bacterium]
MSTETEKVGGPVTVAISRRVKPGREADYEQWIAGIVEAAAGYPGNMGVNVLRPRGRAQKDYVIIFRFDSEDHLKGWEKSAERASWLEKIEGIVIGEDKVERVTGLEFWFTLPEVPAGAPPSQHKMALVLVVVVFFLVLALNLAAGPWLNTLPFLAHIFVVVLFQVLLMTYVIMPRVTRILRPWLFGESRS